MFVTGLSFVAVTAAVKFGAQGLPAAQAGERLQFVPLDGVCPAVQDVVEGVQPGGGHRVRRRSFWVDEGD